MDVLNVKSMSKCVSMCLSTCFFFHVLPGKEIAQPNLGNWQTAILSLATQCRSKFKQL